jgi:mandelamide amidase
MARDAIDLGARELVNRIARGELRAEDCARAALERARAVQGLNALSWIDEARALAAASEIDARRARGQPPGMLAGMPFVVKDNIDVADVPTAAGTPALRDHVARRHAPVVERMLAQGAVFAGKAGMHELAAGATSSNPATGIVRNPWDPARVPGGSSGGTAAAIAARIVPAGLGTDTAGSVRIPAAFTGTVALRPTTFGARPYPGEGVVPLACDLDAIGPMARTVDDVALLHAAITGASLPPLPALSGLRIGVPRRRYWDHLERGVAAACEGALGRLRAAGVVLVDVDASAWFALASEIYTTLLMHGVRSDLADHLVASAARVSAGEVLDRVVSRDTRALYRRAAAARLRPEQVEKARHAVHEKIIPAYREAFRTHGIEALIFPTVPLAAPLVSEAGDGPEDLVEIGGRTWSKVLTLIRNTHVTSALGAPGISLPAGLTPEGLPVGLELDGLPGRDAALLAVAVAVESVLGALPVAGVRNGAR